MIGKLKGTVDEINQDHIIIDVHGVGYKVYLSTSTMSSLQLESHIILNIEMYVREDQMLLYGFNSKLEQKWFNLLQTVQGVGSRVALSILSILKPEQLYYAILSDDQRIIKSISGIGPKLAARIVNELKSHQEISSGNLSPATNLANVGIFPANDDMINDALDALASLGFARSQTMKILTDIKANEAEITLEKMIRLALAKLVPNN